MAIWIFILEADDMTLQELHKKLQFLESQKVQLENEILKVKKQYRVSFTL